VRDSIPSGRYYGPVDGFPHLTIENVRLRDVDSAGHVNNSVYATYLEQARVAIFGFGAPFVLARLAIDFRAPAVFGEEIQIGTRVTRVGHRTVHLQHRVTGQAGLVAEATGVLVAIDKANRCSIPVPQRWRRHLLDTESQR
jgi:acyl-CoA thioester hydrolase